MKRFEFSLDRLLRVKKQLEHIANLELQRAQDAVVKAEANLRLLHDQLVRISDQFATAVGRAMAPQQWASASGMVERVGQSIRVAEREVEETKHKFVEAAQERAQLSTEVEALTTLRKQQFEKWQHEAQKVDQDRLDELVQQRWQADNAREPVVALYQAEPAA